MHLTPRHIIEQEKASLGTPALNFPVSSKSIVIKTGYPNLLHDFPFKLDELLMSLGNIIEI